MDSKQIELEVKESLAKKPEDRTYEDRFNVWMYNKSLEDYNELKDYDEGEEVIISDGEGLFCNKIKDGFGKDFPEWFRNAGMSFGKKVRMIDNEIYTLIGVSYTYLDYYYIVEKDGEISRWSCVAHMEIL